MKEVCSLPTKEAFEIWIADWKVRLGLAHWRVEVDFCPSRELSDPHHSAECWANAETECAFFKIANDSRPTDFIGSEKDWEEVVVHELLHCRFDSSYPCNRRTDDHADLLYERAINGTARAFIVLKRAVERQQHESVSDPIGEDASADVEPQGSVG